MARIGIMRCPCCGAMEDKTQKYLTYYCACQWHHCFGCGKCLEHCGCDAPLPFYDFIEGVKREAQS